MKKRIQCVYFQSDQRGIDDLKNRCFNEADHFSYFRKGAWTGVLDSIANAEAFQANYPMMVASAVAVYPGAKELAKDVAKTMRFDTAAADHFIETFVTDRRQTNHICRRVICSTKVSKKEIARWEAICGVAGVAAMPHSNVGPFTFVVSDQMWAIFSRFHDNDLRGIEGTDDGMISTLRTCFDREFAALKLQSRRNGSYGS